jgi:Putative adhesin
MQQISCQIFERNVAFLMSETTTSKGTMMQKFDTPAPISAIVEIPAGRVQFIAADRADTTVEVRPADADSARDAKAAQQTTAGFAGGVLRVSAAAGSRILGGSGSVEVTVQLPAGSRVEAKAATVEFRAVGRLGDVALDSPHATVKIDEAATARLTTLDGSVSVGRLGGAAEIRTGRGDITIAEAQGGTLVLRTADGAISVDAAAGVAAALDAGTTHGRIRNSLRNGDGAAGLTIHATTDRGDITARSL